MPLGGGEITAPVEISSKNTLVDNQSYTRLGRNQVFEARPSILHFPGYRLHAVHSQTLQVVNISPTTQRLHIINPSTPYFRVRCNKKGVIAPGMAEVITVDFQPCEWKYHYDCIRLHTNDENMLVPIHAYPVMNETIFPTRIEMGACALTETTTRCVTLDCKVPIQFEFELTVVKQHPDFDVFPLRGIVPANGSTKISIAYTPVQLGTTNIEIMVNVSQFNFEPILCTVTGSSHSGMTREQVLNHKASQLLASGELGKTKGATTVAFGATTSNQMMQMEDPALASRMLDSYGCPPPRPPRGSGSGGVTDAGGEWLRQMKRSTAKLTKKPEQRPRTPEQTVEGLRIPGRLDQPNSVSFVLTQQPGKLKPKDLKNAIREQRAIRAKQKEEQEELRRRTGSAAGALTTDAILAEENSAAQAGSSRQLKEMVFLQDLAELEQQENAREFKSSAEFTGEQLMTEEEVTLIVDTRGTLSRRKAREVRESQRQSTETRLMGPDEIPASYGRATSLAGVMPKHVPSFDPFSNNVWKKRRMTLQRLVFLTSKWIVRRRAEKRLQKIWARLGDARTRQEVRLLVELDFQQSQANEEAQGKANDGETNEDEPELETLEAATAAAEDEVRKKNIEDAAAQDGDESKRQEVPKIRRDREAEALKFTLSKEQVHRVLFPRFDEDEATQRNEVSAQPGVATGGFQDITFLNLRVAQEDRAMGYCTIGAPPVPCYVPVAYDREMRTGAPQESAVRLPRAPRPLPPPPSEAEEGGADADNDGGAPPPDASPAPPKTGAEVADLLMRRAADLSASTLSAPASLKKPCKPAAVTLLRADASVRVFQNLPVAQETDPEWILRPRKRERVLPVTRSTVLARAPGSCSLHALTDIPTISEHWRPPCQARASGVPVIDEGSVKTSLWHIPGKLQKLLGGHAVDDDMSDSESEDEGDDQRIRPEPGLAHSLFLGGGEGGGTGEAKEGDEVEGGRREAQEGEDGGDEEAQGGAKKEAEDSASWRWQGLSPSVREIAVDVVRDHKSLEQERAKRAVREELYRKLPSRVLDASTAVANIKNTFTLYTDTAFRRLCSSAEEQN